MQPDHFLVTFRTEGPHVTARTYGPSVPDGAVDSPYGHLTTPLRSAAWSAS